MTELLARLGHRNWIAVVDAAYPEMVAPGITTILGGSLPEVLEAVLLQPHIRAEAFLDAELDHLTDADAPGVEAFRAHLKEQLGDTAATRLPHERIIAMLDEAAQSFRVVVVKTAGLIPYTSVFLRLECGYWSPEAEARLRSRIANVGS